MVVKKDTERQERIKELEFKIDLRKKERLDREKEGEKRNVFTVPLYKKLEK